MTIWYAMLLGIVQGLSEFLPISSSGHLVLVQRIFGISQDMLFFDIMLHIGTLIAVIAVYWHEIVDIFKNLFSKKVGLLILASIPTVALAVLFKDYFENAYTEASLLGVGFLFTSLILTLSDRTKNQHKSLKQMKFTDAVTIGFMQGIAIFPGVSRSGSTIAGGLFCGLDKKFAADFSFLLSIIAITGAFVFKIPDAVKIGFANLDWGSIIIGMGFAALSGVIAIKAILRILQKSGLRKFALYVFILGILVLADQYFFHIFFTTAPF